MKSRDVLMSILNNALVKASASAHVGAKTVTLAIAKSFFQDFGLRMWWYFSHPISQLRI
jgi:hypothetical protein